MQKTRKSLVIVCDDNSQKYAELLDGIISQLSIKKDNTDQNNNANVNTFITSSVWDIKKYIANQQSFASTSEEVQGKTPGEKIKNYTIFIGNFPKVKEIADILDIKVSQHGMVYGSLGTKAVLIVNETKVDKDSYNAFYNFSSSYDCKLEKIEIGILASSPTAIKVAGSFMGAVTRSIVGPIVGSVAAYGFYDEYKTKKKICDQQYKCLVKWFSKEYLNKFMEIE